MGEPHNSMTYGCKVILHKVCVVFLEYRQMIFFYRASVCYALTARYCTANQSVRLSDALWYFIETKTHIVKHFPLSDRDKNYLSCF